MNVYHQRLSVAFDYPVHFTRDVFRPENPLLASVLDRRGEGRRHRLFAAVDAGLDAAQPGLRRRIEDYCRAHGDRIDLVDAPFLVPGGEGAKRTREHVDALVAALAAKRLCRQSFVIAIGGGAVLDVVGLAAALVHRGLRLVRLPTTVLAQNDAGVGVKNGINADGQKNLLGVFAPPFAVIDDFAFLSTLPDVHWRGGIAEAFKVALIKDRGFFEELCRDAKSLGRRDEPAMESLIRRCAILHLDHIAQNGDPFELGTARPLDFGHWSAHKLETLSGHAITHGEAVAAGIALDSYYASREGLITRQDLQRLLAALGDCGFKLFFEEMEARDAAGRLVLLDGLKDFQEHLGGRLTVTLPAGIGAKCERHDLDAARIEEGIAYLRERSRRGRGRADQRLSRSASA
jgi:3-dehydroquinate synthase